MPGLLTSKVRVYECSFEPYSSSLQNEQNPSSNRVSQKYNIKTTGEGHYQVSPSNWLRWMKRWILQGVLLNVQEYMTPIQRSESRPLVTEALSYHFSVDACTHSCFYLLKYFFQEMCRTDAIVVTSLRGCCMNLSVCWGHSSASDSQSWPIESHLPFCGKARISQTTFLATFS